MIDPRWLKPGGVVPVDMPTTQALVNEVIRLREYQGEIEEAEARCCPEDVGFEEWIGVLDKRLAALRPEKTYILLATEKGLTPIGKLVDALQACAMGELDARDKAEEALRQFTMYTDNIAMSSAAGHIAKEEK